MEGAVSSPTEEDGQEGASSSDEDHEYEEKSSWFHDQQQDELTREFSSDSPSARTVFIAPPTYALVIIDTHSYVSRFRSLFNLILLGVFLAFSSLGAGSNERMRTPLGAHQRRFRSQ